MDYTTSYSELNTTLGDSSDITFTPEEKARALKKAWNDSYVVKVVYDSTKTWASNTFSYTLPTALTTITDVYTKQSVDVGAEPIAADLWEVVAGNVIFRTDAANIFASGDVIYFKGNVKLDWDTDTLDTDALQEYVLATAGFHTLSLIGYKKTNLFLKNDTTMSELIGLRREFDTERKELRAKLPRAVQGA